MDERWTVRRWMSKAVHTLGPDDRLVDALELMLMNRIRHIPVIAEDRLVGIISDRDVRHAMPMRPAQGDPPELVYGAALLKTPIAMVMTVNPLTVEPEATIRDAAEIICREKIGALPVLEEGRLVGIVSAEDLLWAFLENTAGLPGPDLTRSPRSGS